MSFILDALKKLEKKRQRGIVPDLTAVHFPEVKELRKRPVWPYLIVAVLILNAVILAVWLRPWKSTKHDVIAKTTTERQIESTKVETVRQGITKNMSVSSSAAQKNISSGLKTDVTNEVRQKPQSSSKVAEQQPADKEPLTIQPKPGAKDISKESRLPKTTSSKPSIAEPQQENASVSIPQPADANKAVAASGIPELSQLPQAIQNELPQLIISGHIYSNSSETRLININGDIFREGDTVVKNLKIEEITENGVVLNYNGTRFRLRAF